MSNVQELLEGREAEAYGTENLFKQVCLFEKGNYEGSSGAPSTCCPSPADEVQDKPVAVGILGATGVVGQRFISLLHGHPWFRVVAVGGSERTAGLKYGEATKWHLEDQAPLAAVRDMEVLVCDAELFKERGCTLAFSALSAEVAYDLEQTFAEAGILIFSNARSWRSASRVPILLPFVNSEHLNLISTQASYRKTGGGIITNGNCSSTGLALALAPILRTWGIERVVVATLQACSGAGYPGESAMDMVDNVVPYISGEEEKLEWEPQKILGQLKLYDRVSTARNDQGAMIESDKLIVPDAPASHQFSKTESLSSFPCEVFIEPAKFESNAMCHRVPVTDGHTMSVVVDLPSGAFPSTACALCVADAVETAIERYKIPEDVSHLPSCPQKALLVLDDDTRPQPRLDRMRGAGMSVATGPVKAQFSRRLQVWSLKFTLLIHNTVLGAGGCSILNAELALMRGIGQSRCGRHSYGLSQATKHVPHLVSGKTKDTNTCPVPEHAKKKRCPDHSADEAANLACALS